MNGRLPVSPKSHNKSDPGSYRPISLLSVLSKLLEKHVRNLLVDHFEEFHPLSTQQWGFTHGKFTTGALLTATDNWHRLLDSGLDICAVFFDFSKAFDTVPHWPLLQKLKDLNVHLHILKCMVNSLSTLQTSVCLCKRLLIWHLACWLWSSSRLCPWAVVDHCLCQWRHHDPLVWWNYVTLCR